MKWTWNKIYILHEKHLNLKQLEMLPWQISLHWNYKMTKTESHKKINWKKPKRNIKN